VYDEIARASSARGEVVLRRRGAGVLELRVNGVFVMDTEQTASEVALATRALQEVADPSVVLVGGLGLGLTAAAVLQDPRVRRLVVVEIEEPVVTWFRDGTVPTGPGLLLDPRLEVVTADVARVVQAAAPGSLDLVLLDVDNGPDFLVHSGNATLYEPVFLGEVARVLRPGGVVAVWSMAPSPALAAHLSAVLGDSHTEPVDVRLQDRAERYWLHLAHR
jgi:spermidine synthase